MVKMNHAKRIVISGLLACCALMLAGCGILDAVNDESYRFRMTVEVQTPQGVRTGSSVYQITAGNRWHILPDERSREVSVRGEAVAVDIAPGKTLFALLKTHAHFESMVGLSMATLDPHFTDRYDVVASARRLAKVNGDGPAVAVNPKNYPMLVTFGDPADPTSVGLVNPADLAASFGKGVSLKRITVQTTHDPVTTGIEKRLPQPSKKGHYGMRVQVGGFERTAILGHWEFSRGIRK